jgi:hypothetical protein
MGGPLLAGESTKTEAASMDEIAVKHRFDHITLERV